MFTSADEVLAYIKAQDVKFVDIRFCDLPGVMQHFNVPAQTLDEDFFTEGQAFDGSSIRGFQAIHESDMKLMPAVATAYLDPFRVEKTLVMNFSIVDPFTDEPYSRDPRNIAAKAEAYLSRRGSPTPPTSAPRRSSSCSTTCGSRRSHPELLLHRLEGGGVEHRPGRGGRQPGLQAADEGRLFPGLAGRPLRRPA